MAGIRLTPEEPEMPVGTPPRPQLPASVAGAGGGSGGLEMASDDERSVAADSWSVRSEYGSTLDDDQRYADAAEVLAAAAASANFPSAASDYWYCISAELSQVRELDAIDMICQIVRDLIMLDIVEGLLL